MKRKSLFPVTAEMNVQIGLKCLYQLQRSNPDDISCMELYYWEMPGDLLVVFLVYTGLCLSSYAWDVLFHMAEGECSFVGQTSIPYTKMELSLQTAELSVFRCCSYTQDHREAGVWWEKRAGRGRNRTESEQEAGR